MHVLSTGTAEVACGTWDTMEWDPGMKAAFVSIAQSKVSKVKIIAWIAGADRGRCIFLALGDFLAMAPLPVYKEDEPAWILPALQNSNPGKSLGDWLRALRTAVRGGSATYAAFAVKSLPESVTAGGIRPGAVTTCMSLMPAPVG